MKFVGKRTRFFFAFTRHRVCAHAERELLAKKISSAISARFQKRGERARSKRVTTPDGNLKKVQNEVRTKFLVVSFHVRLSYYRGRKEKKNE